MTQAEEIPEQRAQLGWNIWARYIGYTFCCALFSERSTTGLLASIFIHPELHYIFFAIIGISVMEAVMNSSRWLGLIIFVSLTGTLALVTYAGHTFAGDVWYLPFRFRMVLALIGGIAALLISFNGRSMSGALLAFLLGQFAGVAACEAALFGARLFHTDLEALMTNSKSFLAPIVTIALATLPLAACNGVIAALANQRKIPPAEVEEPVEEEPEIEKDGFRYR